MCYFWLECCTVRDGRYGSVLCIPPLLRVKRGTSTPRSEDGKLQTTSRMSKTNRDSGAGEYNVYSTMT